jgi:hypothetical protein
VVVFVGLVGFGLGVSVIDAVVQAIASLCSQ